MPIPGQAGGLSTFAKYGPSYYAEIGRKGGLAKAANARTRIMAELQTIVAEIAERARQNASWSSDIQKAISVGNVQLKDGNFYVNILVDIDPETGAPQARAFEYGSGIHSKNGGGTYPIVPKAGLFQGKLAFDWKGASTDFPTGGKYVGAMQNGKLLFWYVDHPGIEAKPYLKPAIQSMLPDMKKRLGSAFKKAFVGESFYLKA